MDLYKIVDFVSKKETISVPEIQQEFNTSYMDTRLLLAKLQGYGYIGEADGVNFPVLSQIDLSDYAYMIEAKRFLKANYQRIKEVIDKRDRSYYSAIKAVITSAMEYVNPNLLLFKFRTSRESIDEMIDFMKRLGMIEPHTGATIITKRIFKKMYPNFTLEPINAEEDLDDGTYYNPKFDEELERFEGNKDKKVTIKTVTVKQPLNSKIGKLDYWFSDEVDSISPAFDHRLHSIGLTREAFDKLVDNSDGKELFVKSIIDSDRRKGLDRVKRDVDSIIEIAKKESLSGKELLFLSKVNDYVYKMGIFDFERLKRKR